MTIRRITEKDIETCVDILIESYNPPPWNDNWNKDTGNKYLSEFISNRHFIGFVIEDTERIVGAIFAHRKTWWTNDEIFIDELFIKPDHQRRGFGQQLVNKIEQISKELGLGGVTLLTNRNLPAREFYNKKGYIAADHIIFMYKEIK